MSITTSTTKSTIIVRASADLYLGAPQFQLLVDGKPVGDVQTVQAVHSYSQGGQWQDFAFTGDFGTTGPGKVEVAFLNDAYDGPGKDRNLYVDKITVNGTDHQAETSTLGQAQMAMAGKMAFDLNGISSHPLPTPAPTPSDGITSHPLPTPAPTPSSGNDTIVVRVSGDQYQGAPQFQLLVDGKPVVGVQTVQAVHSYSQGGQWQDFAFTGDFGTTGPSKVEVAFLNDAFDGPGKDRNLYVDKITVNGTVHEAETSSAGGEQMAMAGKMAFDLNGISSHPLPTPAPTPSGGNDTIVVRVSGDQYQGAPQFQLLVDGEAVGGVQTVQAVHNQGQWQDLAFNANFGANGADKVEVVFLNDAYDGPGKDRNLYVDKITVNGTVHEAETSSIGGEQMAMAGKMAFDVSGSTSGVWDNTTAHPLPAPTPSSGSGGTGPGATGQFTVGSDGRIYDPHGHEFEIHGANLFPNQDDPNMVKVMGPDAWNFNALRIDWIPGMFTYEQLDHTIQTYTSRGIVCIVDWHRIGGYGDAPAEHAAMLDHFSRLAHEYKDNPYVWYGGYNEPGGNGDVTQVNGQWQWDPTDVARWVDQSRDIIQTVRDAGATAPVFAPSMVVGHDILINGNYDFDVGFSRPLEERSAILKYGDQITAGFHNVVFDVHLYNNYNTTDRLQYLDAFLDKVEAKGIPLVFGEYGAGLDQDGGVFQSTIQTSRNMEVLRDQHRVGDMVWNAYSYDANDLTTSGKYGTAEDINSFTHPTNLTELGQIAWDGTHPQ